MHIEEIIKQKAAETKTRLAESNVMVDFCPPLKELLILIEAWQPNLATADAGTLQAVNTRLAEFEKNTVRYVDEELKRNLPVELGTFDEERTRKLAQEESRKVIADLDWVIDGNLNVTEVARKVKDELNYSDLASAMSDYLDGEDIVLKIEDEDSFADAVKKVIREGLE